MWCLVPMHLVLLGLVGGGDTWICFHLYLMVLVRLVDCIVPFLVLCRLCNGLGFGEFWLSCRVVLECIMHVDNLNVVNHVSCIIAGWCAGRPFSLVNDCDLLLKVQQLVRWRRTGNAAVSKVKGHADERLVALGRVREVDRFGNNEADATADLGKRRVHHAVIYAGEMVNRSCARCTGASSFLHSHCQVRS